MASSSETTTAAGTPDASSRDSMELFFFNLFNDNFMRSIGPTRELLEQKYSGMLSDITENLHKLSAYAADMVHRNGLTFKNLAQEEQHIFTGEFLRQIDVFAEKVRESFDGITPEQEKKLLEAYAKPRATDN
jgi:hypothetical protein